MTDANAHSPAAPHTKVENSMNSYTPPAYARDLHTWSSIPQSVPSHSEQDTAKYVYNQPEDMRGPPGEDEQSRSTKRMICGISARLFCLVLLLVVIAIAGAVGGGVGGSLAAKSCQNDLETLRQGIANHSSTTAPTSREGTSSTTSAIATATASSVLAEDATITVPKTGCPESNGTLYTATFGDKSTTFARVCNSVKGGSDIFQASTPSWNSCMDVCVGYNNFFASLDSKGSVPACAGVSYVPEWSVHPEYAYSNYTTRGSCWLKGNMDALDIGWGLGAEVVSGTVQA